LFWFGIMLGLPVGRLNEGHMNEMAGQGLSEGEVNVMGCNTLVIQYCNKV